MSESAPHCSHWKRGKSPCCQCGEPGERYIHAEQHDLEHIATADPSIVLAMVARIRELEERMDIMTSNPHNPNAITAHVHRRAQEASDALGASSIGELPIKAGAARDRIRQLEAALGEACSMLDAYVSEWLSIAEHIEATAEDEPAVERAACVKISAQLDAERAATLRALAGDPK